MGPSRLKLPQLNPNAKPKLKAYLNCIAVGTVAKNTCRVVSCENFSVFENLFKSMIAFSYGVVLALLFGGRIRVLAKTTVNCDTKDSGK